MQKKKVEEFQEERNFGVLTGLLMVIEVSISLTVFLEWKGVVGNFSQKTFDGKKCRFNWGDLN